MAMRVATFANSQQMIAAALRTQATMAEQQMQEASGVMSTDFGGYGSKAQQIIDLQVSVDRAQSYIDTATQVGSKIEVMYSAVNSVADLLTEFRSAADRGQQLGQHRHRQRAAIRAGHAAADGGAAEHAIRRQISCSAARGPTRRRSTSRPRPIPRMTSPSSARHQLLSGRPRAGVGAGLRHPERELRHHRGQYRVRAGDAGHEPGRQRLDRCRRQRWTRRSTSPSARSTLSALCRARCPTPPPSIERASAFQTEYKSFAETLGSDLTGVDVAAVTASLSTYQAQLTASYSAIAKVQSLNLASYLS